MQSSLSTRFQLCGSWSTQQKQVALFSPTFKGFPLLDKNIDFAIFSISPWELDQINPVFGWYKSWQIQGKCSWKCICLENETCYMWLYPSSLSCHLSNFSMNFFALLLYCSIFLYYCGLFFVLTLFTRYKADNGISLYQSSTK